MREDIDKLIWNKVKKRKWMVREKTREEDKEKEEHNEETKAIKMKPYEEEMETMKMKEKKVGNNIYKCHFLDI